MKDDVFKQALKAVNPEMNDELNKMLDSMTYMLPTILKISKELYNESIKQGYSESQSFILVRDYLKSTINPHSN